VDGVVWFNWSLLDSGMYYVDRLENDTRLQYLSFATGKTSTVARNLGGLAQGSRRLPTVRRFFLPESTPPATT
jgi:hypothetical protein